VRPHTVRRPRLALGDGAATRVSHIPYPIPHGLTHARYTLYLALYALYPMGSPVGLTLKGALQLLSNRSK